MRRLREFRDSSTLHEWLDSSSFKCGAILSSNEFVDFLRLRFGASFTEDASEYGKCGIPVGSRMVHAQCCDRSNATKGRYRVRCCVHKFASIHDPLVQLETIALAASNSQLRLTDIFSLGLLASLLWI